MAPVTKCPKRLEEEIGSEDSRAGESPSRQQSALRRAMSTPNGNPNISKVTWYDYWKATKMTTGDLEFLVEKGYLSENHMWKVPKVRVVLSSIGFENPVFEAYLYAGLGSPSLLSSDLSVTHSK